MRRMPPVTPRWNPSQLLNARRLLGRIASRALIAVSTGKGRSAARLERAVILLPDRSIAPPLLRTDSVLPSGGLYSGNRSLSFHWLSCVSRRREKGIDPCQRYPRIAAAAGGRRWRFPLASNPTPDLLQINGQFQNGIFGRPAEVLGRPPLPAESLQPPPTTHRCRSISERSPYDHRSRTQYRSGRDAGPRSPSGIPPPPPPSDAGPVASSPPRMPPPFRMGNGLRSPASPAPPGATRSAQPQRRDPDAPRFGLRPGGHRS